MSPRPIRCVIHTVNSEIDRNGNTYHFCTFYCPDKGRQSGVVWETGGERNGAIAAMRILGDWEQILEISSTIPKRQYMEAHKSHRPLYEGSDDAKKALADLLS